MSIAVPLLLIVSGSPIVFGAAKPVPGKRPPTRELMEDCARIARVDAGYFVEYRDPRDETAAA